MLYTQNKKTLQLEEVTFRRFLLPVLGVIMLFTSVGAGVASKIVVEKIPIVFKEKSVKFSPELVKSEIIALHLPHKEIIQAQILIETGNYSSQVFKLNNNLVGMKPTFSRMTTQNGEQMGFATYENWKESLKDYSIWIALYGNNLTDDQYLELLDKVWAPGQNYRTNLEKLLKQQNAAK